jgi:hypothetical protein
MCLIHALVCSVEVRLFQFSLPFQISFRIVRATTRSSVAKAKAVEAAGAVVAVEEAVVVVVVKDTTRCRIEQETF